MVTEMMRVAELFVHGVKNNNKEHKLSRSLKEQNNNDPNAAAVNVFLQTKLFNLVNEKQEISNTNSAIADTLL